MNNQLTLFDYGMLDPETRIVVQQRTGEIKTLMRRTAQDIIEIGQKLIEVKARLGHGQFGGWLVAEFEWTERTARNYMSVAETFKSETVSDLMSPRALYLLASPSTPEPARIEAIARAEAGETITHKAAQQIVTSYKSTAQPTIASFLPISEVPEPIEDNRDVDPDTGEILNAVLTDYDTSHPHEHRTSGKTGYITLPQWANMTDTERRLMLTPDPTPVTFNNQKNDNIEWARWSWNPVTGCKHDCPYCYARDIAMRFFEQKFEPAFLPGRLCAPQTTVVPSIAQTDIGYKNVFTCSMADLFGRWVPTEWIEAVLDAVRAAPQWNFLFLTKFPIRLSEFDFPDNAWVGTTVDCQIRVKNAEMAFRKVRAKVKWLSCEPMLDPLRFNDLSIFQWIVLGGSSTSTKTPEWHPPREWINRVEDQARAAGCKIYEKTNLLERIREYPWSDTTPAVLPESLRYLPSVEVIAP